MAPNINILEDIGGYTGIERVISDKMVTIFPEPPSLALSIIGVTERNAPPSSMRIGHRNASSGQVGTDPALFFRFQQGLEALPRCA